MTDEDHRAHERCAANPDPRVGLAWLHTPTGSAGLDTFAPHHDRGPIVHHCTCLLQATTPVPLPDGHPHAQRTHAHVEASLHAHGWRVATRAEAAAALRAAGYVLGTNRAPGHALYADQADETVWHVSEVTEYEHQVFAVRARVVPAEVPATAHAFSPADVALLVRAAIRLYDAHGDVGDVLSGSQLAVIERMRALARRSRITSDDLASVDPWDILNILVTGVELCDAHGVDRPASLANAERETSALALAVERVRPALLDDGKGHRPRRPNNLGAAATTKTAR